MWVHESIAFCRLYFMAIQKWTKAISSHLREKNSFLILSWIANGMLFHMAYKTRTQFNKGGKTNSSRPFSSLDISRVKKGIVHLHSVYPKRITKIDDLPIWTKTLQATNRYGITSHSICVLLYFTLPMLPYNNAFIMLV